MSECTVRHDIKWLLKLFSVRPWSKNELVHFAFYICWTLRIEHSFWSSKKFPLKSILLRQRLKYLYKRNQNNICLQCWMSKIYTRGVQWSIRIAIPSHDKSREGTTWYMILHSYIGWNIYIKIRSISKITTHTAVCTHPKKQEGKINSLPLDSTNQLQGRTEEAVLLFKGFLMTAPHPLFQGTTKVLHFPSSAFLGCLKGFSEKREQWKKEVRGKTVLFF